MSNNRASGSSPSRALSERHRSGTPTRKSGHSRMPSLPLPLLSGLGNPSEKQEHANTDPMPSLKSPTRRFFSSRRTRSKSPAPIITSPTAAAVTAHPLVASPLEGSFTAHPGHVVDSPLPMSPSASPSEPSYSSSTTSSSGKKRHSHGPRKSSGSGDYKRLSGTVNHCGRHGNDWLFGGFSVRERVRELLKDDEGRERRSSDNERQG